MAKSRLKLNVTMSKPKDYMTWFLALLIMAGLVGSFCAVFLWSLEKATELRFFHPALLYGLPFIGAAIGYLYAKIGGASEKGNNLLIEEIDDPQNRVPLRMAPLVFIGTVTSHLCGASVGREGTALQLGGATASFLARLFKFNSKTTRLYLIASLAAGFGAVFGTPIAGAVFALEVLAIGNIEYGALFPALIASVTADWVCQKWGIQHTVYHVVFGNIAQREGGIFL
ncbi:hypothetical protein GT348_05055 [Aristophania vespae]|uniref:Chloride channel protein n=1 Tax=Aristophania vespae TaxID=2697033 RepID=A0A6P1NDY7_9PROT|nr:chloride channel protein [Aristophania vespae]QHI95709.1 hypothetical protein GT348_05055 [Aristophania vespae]